LYRLCKDIGGERERERKREKERERRAGAFGTARDQCVVATIFGTGMSLLTEYFVPEYSC
jgi:hypothetical protein